VEPQGWLSATCPAPACWSRRRGIGSNFVYRLLARHPGAHVVVLDALTYAGRRENLDGIPPAQLTFIPGDIRDPAVVAKAMSGCAYVVNFAAESHVDRSIETPGEFIQTDVYGVFVLAEEARRVNVKRFIQVSTDEVYGEVLEGHSTEEWPLHPRSPYAASKAGGDRLAYAYWCTYGLPVVVTRCSNNYGPRQYPEKLVPLFVTNAIEDQPLPVYGTGKNTRDWLHVDDHCDALLTLLTFPGVEGETFNIGASLSMCSPSPTRCWACSANPARWCAVEDRPATTAVTPWTPASSRVTGWKPEILPSRHPPDRGLVPAEPQWWRAIKSGDSVPTTMHVRPAQGPGEVKA
jgi:dTDP-glucose 4,6-dehydratase